MAVVAAPIDDYKKVGEGDCQPEKGKFYPSVSFDVNDLGLTAEPEECAAACE